MDLLPLLLPLFSGAFFGLGFILVKFFKKKKELTILANGMAFVVMLGMVFFDLMPEIIEIAETLHYDKFTKIIYVCILIFFGIMILKVFDMFLPAHHHEHKEGEHNHKEHNHHMFHIGLILALSLILHNALEGMSIYLIGTEKLSAGFLLSLGVGLHNLPLGIEIASNLENEKKRMTILTLILLFCSSFVGAFILYLFPYEVSSFLQFIFLGISCGMILYISLFELLQEIFNYKKNKFTYYGMLVGIFFLILMTFFE